MNASGIGIVYQDKYNRYLMDKELDTIQPATSVGTSLLHLRQTMMSIAELRFSCTRVI
jgi:hypothetical protein